MALIHHKMVNKMLVTRYLLKNLLGVTVFVVLTLIAVIWLTQSLKLLELVANSDAPPGIFIKLVALTIPRFLEIILPLSLVTAILFVYHKLILDNELIVLRACGFDQYALARPALLLALLATAILLALTTYISPLSYAEVHLLRQKVQSEYSSLLLREGVFNTFGNNLTVYVRKRAQNGDLAGLLIHDTREKDKPPVTVTAKKGRLLMQDGMPQIVVFDGMRQQADSSNGALSRLYFSKYTIEIKGFEGEEEKRWKEPSERTIRELFNPDLTFRTDRTHQHLFVAEAHHRLVTPFNVLGFSLVALACILVGPFNRRGQGKKVMIAAALIVILEASNLLIVSGMKKHAGVTPLLYVATFLPVALGLYSLHFRGEQKVLSLLRALRRRSSSGEAA